MYFGFAKVSLLYFGDIIDAHCQESNCTYPGGETKLVIITRIIKAVFSKNEEKEVSSLYGLCNAMFCEYAHFSFRYLSLVNTLHTSIENISQMINFSLK